VYQPSVGEAAGQPLDALGEGSQAPQDLRGCGELETAPWGKPGGPWAAQPR
jgi:hypothetical protein